MGWCLPVSLLLLLLLLVTIIITSPAPCTAARTGTGTGSPPPHKLLLVLLDGMRWDYLNHTRPRRHHRDSRDDRDGDTPPRDGLFFHNVHYNGVSARYVTPEFPTKSLPNYYTIVTGLHPESHGMSGNYMWDAQHDTVFDQYFSLHTDTQAYWWNQTTPLWVSTELHSLRTHVYFWCGCDVEFGEGAGGGVAPSVCETYNHSQTVLVSAFSERLTLIADSFRANTSDVALLYYEGIDTTGHRHGPDSEEVADEVAKADLALHEFYSNVNRSEVNVLLVSDHGMTLVDTGTSVINMDGYVTRDYMQYVARILGYGPYMKVYVRDNQNLPYVYESLKNAGIPHAHVYLREEFPDRWHLKHATRMAPILVLMDQGWLIITNDYIDILHPPYNSTSIGVHGYDNSYMDMKGFFAAIGPDFGSDVVVDSLNLVDIYQLVCHLLDIAPAHEHNGTWSSVAPLLSDRSPTSPPPDNSGTTTTAALTPQIHWIILMVILCMCR